MVRKKPKFKEPPKVEPQNPPANDCNWRDIFACNGLLAKGATGRYRECFSGTLKVQGTPGALKRTLQPEFNQKMVQFFQEFEIMKAW